jgi:hypothetical protein
MMLGGRAMEPSLHMIPVAPRVLTTIARRRATSISASTSLPVSKIPTLIVRRAIGEPAMITATVALLITTPALLRDTAGPTIARSETDTAHSRSGTTGREEGAMGAGRGGPSLLPSANC